MYHFPVKMSIEKEELLLNIGESFKLVRTTRNLTQVQLAEKLGISDKMISQIENGFRPPSAEILKNMAECLNCSADEILGVERDR